jgi:hypothetical protein
MSEINAMMQGLVAQAVTSAPVPNAIKKSTFKLEQVSEGETPPALDEKNPGNINAETYKDIANYSVETNIFYVVRDRNNDIAGLVRRNKTGTEIEAVLGSGVAMNQKDGKLVLGGDNDPTIPLTQKVNDTDIVLIGPTKGDPAQINIASSNDSKSTRYSIQGGKLVVSAENLKDSRSVFSIQRSSDSPADVTLRVPDDTLADSAINQKGKLSLPDKSGLHFSVFDVVPSAKSDLSIKFERTTEKGTGHIPWYEKGVPVSPEALQKAFDGVKAPAPTPQPGKGMSK